MNPRVSTLNDQKTSRRRHWFGFGAVVALGLMLVAMTINSFMASKAQSEAEHWQLHTLQVLLTTEQVRSAVNEALRGERGYIITRTPQFLGPYEHGRKQAPQLLRKLRELTYDNPGQQPHLAKLSSQIPAFFAVLDRTVAHVRADRMDAAMKDVRAGLSRREIETILNTVDAIEAEEQRLLTERSTANERAIAVRHWADIGIASLALLFLMIVTWAGVTASKARMHTLKLEERLRRMATTDSLTGLLNRRAFLERLDTEIARSARNGSPLAVAMVDLDYFKSINDRFGHQGGDDVLRKFAEVAQETTRAADVLGRLGGEEFAVLMPDTDRVESGIAAERLRDAVARRHFVTENGALVPTTISVGVAHFTPGESRERIIGRADEALYDAKHGGRNRTRLAA